MFVGESRIRNGVLGHGLTTQLLCQMIEALIHGIEQSSISPTSCAGVLLALAGVPRFDIAVLLMAPQDKALATNLLQMLENGPVDKPVVKRLRDSFLR